MPHGGLGVTRRALIAAVATVLVAGCGAQGGGDTTDAAKAGNPTPGAAANSQAASLPSAEPSLDAGDPLGFGKDENTSSVTIGGETYEFADLYCVVLAGALSAASVGGDLRVSIDLPPAGWESSGEDWNPPGVKVQVGDETVWIAASGDPALEEIPADMSAVTDYQTDGSHATGTALFVDSVKWFAYQFQDGPKPEPQEGTFEVTCAAS
jgi:hypothetical protein